MVETKANTNRFQSSKNISPGQKGMDGYKGMDGKTYKSFLDYRKNSEKRL